MVRFAARILGEDRIILITDGVRSTGMPDGKYVYNGVEFISSNGTARYVDGTLIGTSAGMNELAKRFTRFTGTTLSTVAKVAAYNPARLLGVEDCKGSVGEGKDADMVVMRRDFGVRMTLIGGTLFET
jgi:N-acetylglucosamine-6-phosphate deacetylase